MDKRNKQPMFLETMWKESFSSWNKKNYTKLAQNGIAYVLISTMEKGHRSYKTIYVEIRRTYDRIASGEKL